MRRGPLGRVGRRITAPVLVLMVLLVAVSAVLLTYGAGRSRAETLDEYAGLLGRLVMSHLRDAMQSEDRPRLQRQIHRIAELQPIVGVRVLDKSGRVVFADDRSEVGLEFQRDEPDCRICHIEEGKPPTRDRTLSITEEGRRIVRTVQSIAVEEECTRCHEGKPETVVGVLITDLDEDVLTGNLRARTGTAVWSVVGMTLLVLVVLIVSIRRLVVARVRALRGLLDRLRSGARSMALTEAPRDEIDDLARSVQAFALDLDERVAVQRAATVVLRVLEAHPAPALILDDAGYVVAANQRAAARLALGGAASVVGRPREDLASADAGMIREAREQGWALPPERGPGPVIVALADDEGGVIGFLEAWSGDSETGENDVEMGVPLGVEDNEWLFYATVLVERVRSDAKKWKRILVVDRRLLLGRRLARELAQAADSIQGREDVDLGGLSQLALQDARSEWRDRHWHTLLGVPMRVTGSRYQLRMLVARLLRAAGRQAGDGGHVLLFGHRATPRRSIFLGTWASEPGARAKLDPPGSPRLAQSIARVHGGGVEVDPEFDVGPLARRGGLRLPCGTVGSLFVTRLPAGETP